MSDECFLVVSSDRDKDDCHFLRLPNEILAYIVLYLDIPSIGAVAQTSKPKNGTLSQLVSPNEDIWFEIVKARFNVSSSLVKRPKLFGGPNWKHSYRSMSLSHRMPKVRLPFKKKTVVAKGSNRGANCWIMINHTEDCSLRQISPDVGIRSRYILERPCIEFQCAYQNIKSTYATLFLDLHTSRVVSYYEHESGESGQLCQDRMIDEGILKPKVIYRSVGSKVIYRDIGKGKKHQTSTDALKTSEVDRSHLYYYFDDQKEQQKSIDYGSYIELAPFEFIIVSINVPLTCGDIQSETDFLSRAVSFMTVMSFDINNLRPLPGSKTFLPPWFEAKFIEENEIWDHYIQLPGNYLTIRDRNIH